MVCSGEGNRLIPLHDGALNSSYLGFTITLSLLLRIHLFFNVFKYECLGFLGLLILLTFFNRINTFFVNIYQMQAIKC